MLIRLGGCENREKLRLMPAGQVFPQAFYPILREYIYFFKGEKGVKVT